MKALEQALSFTLGYEGGYANHPNDAGGETFRGISRRFHPNWEGWPVIDGARLSPEFPKNVNFNGPLEDMVMRFYVDGFWEPIHGDELPPKTAIALFDCAVHAGPATAIRLLQKALNVESDGVIGSRTVKAAHDAGQNGVLEFLVSRAAFLNQIMFERPDQRVWSRNWCRRLFKLADIVLDDAPAVALG